jgi:EmrB/QacA subfamily drug resistance transporter
VALPQIVADFDSSIGSAGWLVTSYLLALAVVQPPAGKLGDRYGRRPFVLGGLLVFGIASLGASVAPSLSVLVLFRVLQAVSGAIVFPNGIGLIRELIQDRRRGRALGLVGAGIALAAGLGPPLGGLLVSVGGWRSIFWVNLPLVALALLFAWRAVPPHPGTRPVTPFDWLGSFLLLLVLGGAAGLVVEGRHAPWVLVPGVVTLIAAAVVFVQRELAHADPVVQLRFFRRRPFAAATAAVASSNLAMYTFLLATPILLARHLHWSSLQTGLALALLSLPMVVFAPLGGRLADRLGRRPPVVAGCVLVAAGVLPLTLEPGIGSVGLAACLLAAGAGIGLSSAGMQASAVEAIEREQAGVAAGIYSTSRYVGSFAGSIALARLLDGGEDLDGFRAVFAMALAGALVAVVASLALPRTRYPSIGT